MSEKKSSDNMWGIGIAVTLILFVLMLISAIFFSSLQPNDMVTKRYYADGIDYQQQKDRMERTQALGIDLQVLHDSDRNEITLHFPDSIDLSLVKGMIELYRPSNARFDKQVPIKLGPEGFQTISSDRMPKGLWKVKVDWHVGAVEYYSEKTVIIN
jgi:nitrogen fixation protein FixH